MMYNIVSRMAVIAILGLISMPISGMEEQRAISERDAASKRQRVADRDPREAVTTAPERQTFKVERDEETEVPLQPVITNSQILEVLTGFRTLFGDRMDHIEAIMQAKFAENDVKLGVLMRAMAEIQRSLPPRLMPAPAAKAPARAQPKPASQPGPLPIHPPQFLQAQHSLGEQARPSNAAPGTLSFGLLAATNLPPQFLQANAAAATALAKLPPPQLLQAQQAPQSARPLPPQNPTTTQQRSCTYTETNDFVAHEEAINYVKQSANTTFSSSSDSLKSSNKDAVCQVIKRHPCAASCVELYESGAGVRPLHLCIGSLLDNTVKVMIGNGSVKTFAGHAGRVNYVSAYTMDGRKATHILSASADNTIKLWDLENDLLVRTFSGHTGSVNALCRIELLSQKCIVSGSADMSIKIWDILDGKLIRTISGHEGSVDCLEVIDAGFQRKLIISGSADGTVRLWGQEGQSLCTIPHGEAVHSVKCCHWGPQYELIAIASQSKIKLWLVKLNEGHPESVSLLHTINATNDGARQNNLSDDKLKISAMDLFQSSSLATPSDEYILTYGTNGGHIKKGTIKIS